MTDKIKPSFDIENSLNSGFVFGIDEAGRGPLAGDVFACCAWLNQSEFPIDLLEKINDSKKLSEKKRESVFDELISLKSDIFKYGIGRVDAKTIDEINILQATFLAMEKAFDNLVKQFNSFDDIALLIDGNVIPNFCIDLISANKISVAEPIISGDSKSYSIAAASIIAKVARDRYIREISLNYPNFNFSKHKGYGTKLHIDEIKQFGPSDIHRMSFLKNILK